MKRDVEHRARMQRLAAPAVSRRTSTRYAAKMKRERRQHVERVRLRRLHDEPVAGVDEQHGRQQQDAAARSTAAAASMPATACGRQASTNIQIGCTAPMSHHADSRRSQPEMALEELEPLGAVGLDEPR